MDNNTYKNDNDNNLFDDLHQNTPDSEGINFDFSQNTAEDFDFSASSDDSDFFGNDFQFETEEESTKKEESARGAMHEAAARQYVQTFQIALSRIGAYFAKSSNPDSYKLSEQEAQEYETVSAAYFESIDWQPSPGTMFFGATAMLSLGVMARAYSDRQDNIALEKHRKATQRWKTASSEAEAKAAAEEMKHFGEKTEKANRKRFNVDNLGFYIYDEAGDYVKQSNRAEKPGQQVLDLIARFKLDENGEKRKWGDINDDIRSELGLSKK